MAGVSPGKIQFNVEIEPRDMDAVNALCDRYGVSKSALVRLLVRDRIVELSRTEGFTVTKNVSHTVHKVRRGGRK